MKNFDLSSVDEESTGKNIDSLRKSRKIRSDFIVKYGSVPTSILNHVKSDKSLDLIAKENSYFKTSRVHKIGIGSKKEREIFDVSGQDCRDGALSRLPQNIGRLIVDFYCPENGIVYDPFAGHNSRMQLVYESKRNYIGVDISKEFMEANRKIRDKLSEENENVLLKNKSTIELIEGSSDSVDLQDNHADFTITSPPYWDLEYYGDEPEQLGKNKTYEGFLKCLKNHAKENYRILKEGSFCAWFVNDFRKNNVFYPYHSDLIPLFADCGFELFSIYIVDLGYPISASFVQGIIKTKQFPKRHEYCLLFRK